MLMTVIAVVVDVKIRLLHYDLKAWSKKLLNVDIGWIIYLIASNGKERVYIF